MLKLRKSGKYVRTTCKNKANIVLPAKDILLHIPALSDGDFSAMLVKILLIYIWRQNDRKWIYKYS